MKELVFVACVLCLGVSVACAQQGSNIPLWVRAMNDTAANYYEAVQSFNQYWKNKETPIEEAEILNQKIDRRERREIRQTQRKLKNMSPTERQQFDQMAYQFKRFKNWQKEVKPYVQENGHILTVSERQAIWNQQQREANN